MHCLTLEIDGHWGPALAGRAGTSTDGCAAKAPELAKRVELVSSAASRYHSLSSLQLVEQASYTACSSLNNTLSSFENVIGWLNRCKLAC